VGKLRNDLWTPEKLKAARAIVKESSSLNEAAARISSELGRPTNGHALTQLFLRRGIPHPLSMLRAADPVQRAALVDSATRLKREHADLVERLRESEARQKVLDRLGKPTKIPEIKARETKSGLREATPVAMLSDLHVEETVTREQSGGINEYNLDIAQTRLERFFAGVAWLNELYRSKFVIRDVVLAAMGDWITGYIHEEMVENNSLSPIEALVWLRPRIVAGINFLLKDPKLERVVIPCVAGNHGRTTKFTHVSTYHENSFEYLLYMQLASEFADNPRVTFVVDKSPHQWVSVFGKTIHVTHGDSLKYGGGVGGLSIPLGKRVPIWDKIRKSDVHLLGHFHTFRDYHHTVANGSMIGYGAYSMSIGADPEPPQQGYFLMDSKHGKTCVSPIWLDK
jgi:hypothetical protein